MTLQTASGARRHRVTLANVTGRTADGQGGYTDTVVALTPAWWYVAIEDPAPSDERVAGQGVQAAIRHIVRGPYRPDVTTATILTKPGTSGRSDRTFYVRGVGNVDEADIELVCDCEEARGS